MLDYFELFLFLFLGIMIFLLPLIGTLQNNAPQDFYALWCFLIVISKNYISSHYCTL